MRHHIGSVGYLRELGRENLVRAQERAETIAAIARQNFDDWPTMTEAEKDVANRQAQRRLAEFAEGQVRIVRYLLNDLRREG
jgi:hypothetical protein